MITLQQQIDIYLQRILAAQYDVSEQIEHNLTKGELREKFIEWIITEQYPKLIIKRGIIFCEAWQSSQIDFIWLKNNARVGLHGVFDIDDINMAMEIKSNAQASEIEHLNDTAKDIKEKSAQNQDVKVGMFCYCSRAMRKTIIPKFGFSYDTKLDIYDVYNISMDQFPYIDFFFSLDISHEKTPYFIYRGNERQDENDAYPMRKNLLFLQDPVICDFLRMFQKI